MKNFQVLFILAFVAANAQAGLMPRQGTAGVTTRYWDCCKASCSWNNKAPFSAPVNTCDINDNPLSTASDPRSGCDSSPVGVAYTCSSQQPFAIDDSLAYGFTSVTGSTSESDACCACYKLTFTDQITIKVMVVQATNIGYDVKSVQFDLAIPGGGVGAFPQGCQRQYSAPTLGWGSDQNRPYGGVAQRTECDSLPARLQPGCLFRWDWMQGANNPSVQYDRVSCPNELVAKTNCRRNDDGKYPAPPTASGASSTELSSTKPLSTKSSSSKPSSTKSSSTKSSSTKPSSTKSSSTKSSATSSPSSATAARYGQCGGQGWKGPTKCEAGTTCQKQNQYYAQCL